MTVSYIIHPNSAGRKIDKLLPVPLSKPTAFQLVFSLRVSLTNKCEVQDCRWIKKQVQPGQTNCWWGNQSNAAWIKGECHYSSPKSCKGHSTDLKVVELTPGVLHLSNLFKAGPHFIQLRFELQLTMFRPPAQLPLLCLMETFQSKNHGHFHDLLGKPYWHFFANLGFCL